MQLSKRSKISLAQLVIKLNRDTAFMLLEKHNFDPYNRDLELELGYELQLAPEDNLSSLIK